MHPSKLTLAAVFSVLPATAWADIAPPVKRPRWDDVPFPVPPPPTLALLALLLVLCAFAFYRLQHSRKATPASP